MAMDSISRRSLLYRHRQSVLMAVALAGLTGVLALVMPARHVGAASSIAPPTGRMLASNCFQCHGTDGRSGAFDELAGTSQAEMFEELKDQQKKNSIMGSQARGYTDAELREIAKYFASIPKK